jgi:hypothetical protein
VVERAVAWISKRRRTVGDDEPLPDQQAMVAWDGHLGMMTIMTHRLAHQHHPGI